MGKAKPPKPQPMSKIALLVRILITVACLLYLFKIISDGIAAQHR